MNTIYTIINDLLDGISYELEELINNNSDYNKGVQDCINYIKSQKRK